MSSDSVTRECITKSNRAGSYGVTVGPGDIILFSRNCYRMNPFPALLCYCAKIGAWSHWDHVGIVVPYEEKTNSGPDAISSKTQRLGLLEINIGGVTLRPLTERILRSSSHRIAVRQLVAPPGSGRIERDAMNKRLADAASRLMKMQYNDSKLALSNSMLQSHWSHAQRNRAALLDMASIDRDMSDLAAELAAHGITCTDDKIGAAAAMCKIDDRGATAPLLQLWANDHMQSLLEHRRIDKKAVEAHYLIHEVAATSQRAGENYFCSDLVADVLHDCGVLHAAVRDRTHMLLPADLSSTAVVAGVSLYMNSNSNNKNYNVTKNCQHYKMTPDIEFVKKGLRMTENADGTVFLESSTSLRSESAEAENASALVCIKFAPGDVLPLHWLKGAMAPSSEKSKEIFTVTIQEGSVELLTPGYSYIGEPVHQCEVHHSAHEAHGLFRVARLSAKPNQISTLRYARDGSFPFEFDLDKCSDWVHQHSITNGGDDVDPAYSSTGWFLVNVNEEKSWVWSCSRNCRLRAGRDGAVLTIRIDNFSNLHLVGGVSSLSDASNCKISALDENAGIEALEAAVRLLLPHPSVVSPHSSRSDKNLCNELVRSIRRHASVLTISPPTVDSSGSKKISITSLSSHTGSSLGPDVPLLLMTEGEMTLRSSSHKGTKSHIVSRLVVEKDHELPSDALSNEVKSSLVQIPTYRFQGGVCVVDAETLISPNLPQTLLATSQGDDDFYWVAERPCEFIALDRVSCIRAGLTYGYGIADMMHIPASVPRIISNGPITGKNQLDSTNLPWMMLAENGEKARLVDAILHDRWDLATIGVLNWRKKGINKISPVVGGGHVTSMCRSRIEGRMENGTQIGLTIGEAAQKQFLNGRHFLLSSNRPIITLPPLKPNSVEACMDRAGISSGPSFFISPSISNPIRSAQCDRLDSDITKTGKSWSTVEGVVFVRSLTQFLSRVHF